MSGLGDPATWSATALAAAMRGGELGVEEVVAAHLERLDEIAPLNAVVTARRDDALADARQAQERLDRGDAVGPLHGVPFTVKDIVATAGVRTTAGTRLLADHVPDVDATAVARLHAAGAILVGKTNCPEFAFGVTTSSPLFGETTSPLGSGLSPGGSSGGEAVAVHTGASALGIGSDFGGSLRWPAQCCGIVALRPTPGRVPATGQIPGCGGGLADGAPALPNPATLQRCVQAVGPLARTVADLELALVVLAGPDGLDPAAAAVPVSAGTAVEVSALRVGWSDGNAIAPVRREVSHLVEAVAVALADDGVDTRSVQQAFVGAHEAFNALRDLEPLADHRAVVAGRLDEVSPFIRATLEKVPPPDELAHAAAWRDALAARAQALEVFDDVDVVVLPVAPGPACALDGTLDVDGVLLEGWQLMPQCRAVSLLGAPVVSVPVGRSAEGLPLSVQVVGRPWAEAEVLAVAAWLEQRFAET